MQALLTLDVARDAVAQQFASTEDETAPAAAPATPSEGVRATRTRLARVLHRLADVVAPRPAGALRTAR